MKLGLIVSMILQHMKVFFRNIHLYLALAAGLVIMSCCFSGAILVFEKELQEAFNDNRYFVKKENEKLLIDQLVNIVKQKYPSAKISSVKIYPDPERSIEVGISLAEKRKGKGNGNGVPKGPGEKNEELRVEKKDNAQAKENGSGKPGRETKNGDNVQSPQVKKGKRQIAPAGGAGRPTHTVFVNPYNGRVLELYNYQETFFYSVFSLHRWLLGGSDGIGKTITGIATAMFLIILITGIILWWPRNKAILMQRLKIKTGASWKRFNHDLHIVMGFYSAIFLFIFAFTALAWSFKWFNDGIYKVTGSSMKPAEPPHSRFQPGRKRISYDSAFMAIKREATNARYYILRAPDDSMGIFSATVLPLNVHESAVDNYYIDQYSGDVISTLKYKDKNLGQRVRSTFKPIHVGSIYGWPSKVIAFFVCILGVTFPVTGVIMWINRLRKNKRNKTVLKRSAVAVASDEVD